MRRTWTSGGKREGRSLRPVRGVLDHVDYGGGEGRTREVFVFVDSAGFWKWSVIHVIGVVIFAASSESLSSGIDQF
jgi:hypothetical protein